MRRAVLAAAAAALLVAVGLAVPLLRDQPRLIATNGHPNTGPAVFLAPEQEACQVHEDLPAEAHTLVVPGGVDGLSGPIEVTYKREGSTVAIGRSEPFRTGPVRVPIVPPAVDVLEAELCVRNVGTKAISLGGAPAGDARDRRGTYANLEEPAVTAGKPQPGRIRVEYPLPGRRSALSVAGRVAERAGMLKASPIGTWTIWFALGITAGCGVLGVIAIGRGRS